VPRSDGVEGQLRPVDAERERPQGNGLGDREPGEDEGVRLNRPIDFFAGKAPGSRNFLDDEKGNGVHYPQPNSGKEMPS
jgi:hypothetical protein